MASFFYFLKTTLLFLARTFKFYSLRVELANFNYTTIVSLTIVSMLSLRVKTKDVTRSVKGFVS